MKRFTLVLTLCLTLCLIYLLSKAQDAPLWKYIASTKNEITGEETTFHARDSHRFTDTESEKYPKLTVKSSGRQSTVKESVIEYDCKRRAERTRIFTYADGTEHKVKELDWEEVVPGSAGEALLDYACRERAAPLGQQGPTQEQIAHCAELYLRRRDAEFLKVCNLSMRLYVYSRQPRLVSGLIAIAGHPDINEEARILALQERRHLTAPRK